MSLMIAKILTTSIIKQRSNKLTEAAALIVDDISGCLDREDETSQSNNLTNIINKSCDMPVQIYGAAHGVGNTAAGSIAAVTALQSVLYDVNKYIGEYARDDYDFADLADRISEHADHAVRQQLAAYYGLRAGTGLSWLLIEDDVAYTYSLGNSDIFLYRADKLYKITSSIENSTQDTHLGYRAHEGRIIPQNLNRMPLQIGDIIIIAGRNFSEKVDQFDLEAKLGDLGAFSGVSALIEEMLADAGGSVAVVVCKVSAINDQIPAPVDKGEQKVKHSRIRKM